MKIKLLTLTTLTLSFLLSAPPTAVAICYFPSGDSFDHYEDCIYCENIGFKLNYQNGYRRICMHSGCVVGKRTGNELVDVGCQKCISGFYVFGNVCRPCPPGATCEGETITCSDGYYKNGYGCSPCHSSCKTCSGARNNNCTSCDPRAYLSGGQCVDCPDNAVCDGSSYFSCDTGYSKSGDECVRTSCNSGKYFSGGQCVDCPAHAVCDGSSYFSCATGYIKSDGACVKEEQEPTKTNTVNTCPSRMTLSADGCCCVNK